MTPDTGWPSAGTWVAPMGRLALATRHLHHELEPNLAHGSAMTRRHSSLRTRSAKAGLRPRQPAWATVGAVSHFVPSPVGTRGLAGPAVLNNRQRSRDRSRLCPWTRPEPGHRRLSNAQGGAGKPDRLLPGRTWP